MILLTLVAFIALCMALVIVWSDWQVERKINDLNSQLEKRK